MSGMVINLFLRWKVWRG